MNFVVDVLATIRRIKSLDGVHNVTKESLTVSIVFGISCTQIIHLLEKKDVSVYGSLIIEYYRWRRFFII